jgi:hypothetical protein
MLEWRSDGARRRKMNKIDVAPVGTMNQCLNEERDNAQGAARGGRGAAMLEYERRDGTRGGKRGGRRPRRLNRREQRWHARMLKGAEGARDA